MRYPIENASSLPGSGNALYFHLIDNIHIPAKLSHTLWYNGCKSLVDDPSNPFMGFFPVGRTLELSYSGSPMQEYTFTGEEKNPVFVKDLSLKTMLELGISKTAKESIENLDIKFSSTLLMSLMYSHDSVKLFFLATPISPIPEGCIITFS